MSNFLWTIPAPFELFTVDPGHSNRHISAPQSFRGFEPVNIVQNRCQKNQGEVTK